MPEIETDAGMLSLRQGLDVLAAPEKNAAYCSDTSCRAQPGRASGNPCETAGKGKAEKH
jgi:hypothetical protein